MLPRIHPALRAPRSTPNPSPEPVSPKNFFDKVEQELVDIWNDMPDSPMIPLLYFYQASNLTHESDFYNTINCRDKFILSDGYKVLGYIDRNKVYDLSMFY